MDATVKLVVKTDRVEFFVPGIPRPGGSKKQMHHSKTGRIITMESGKYTANWRSDVRVAARPHCPAKPLEGPLLALFVFYMPRPKGHRRKNGDLFDWAPEYPLGKPDTTKLIRSTEDALTGLLWVDDAQIVRQEAWKLYADEEHPVGARIAVARVEVIA